MTFWADYVTLDRENHDKLYAPMATGKRRSRELFGIWLLMLSCRSVGAPSSFAPFAGHASHRRVAA